MKAVRLLAVLVTVCLFVDDARSHGGTYRAPTPGPGTNPGIPSTGVGKGRADNKALTQAGTGFEPDMAGWRRWWAFNSDPFLDLKAAIHAEGARTVGDELYLGQGQRSRPAPSYRPSTAAVFGKVVPALLDVLENERQNDLVTGALLALAKIGEEPGVRGRRCAEAIQRHFDSANQEISEAAVLAYGVLGNDRCAPTLAEILRDSEAGRRLMGGGKVSERTRAFAAYGLGQLGSQTRNEDVRRYVVHQLTHVLDTERTAGRDLPVACLISLGLVKLKPAVGEARASSRQAQVDTVLGFLADNKLDEQVRAYAPVAAARLAMGTGEEPRLLVGEALLALIEKGSKAPKPIQQGAVQALGLVVRGDGTEFDRRAREELFAFRVHGDRLGRNLALVALARAASRPGSGEHADEAVAPVRSELLKVLARGKTIERPWAGIGLGILERLRTQQGLAADEDVRRAVRDALKNNKGPTEAGGLSIAAGLMRDLDAGPDVVRIAGNSIDDELRGYGAIALGLMDFRSAIPLLRNTVADSRFRPRLLREAAVGLALLGDKEVVPLLVEMLASAKSLATQASIATGLGSIGDSRSIDPLLELMTDRSEVDSTRAFSAVALGIVCDRFPLPFQSRLAVDVSYWMPPPTLHDPATGTGVLDIL